MSDWRMRRIESTSENPCCALVREAGLHKATVYYVPETQTWGADVMRGDRRVRRWENESLLMALAYADGTLDIGR